MSDTIVTFGTNGVRILNGVDAKHFEGIPGVAVNPDLSAVSGIPPHHWRLEGSSVVPVDEDKRTEPNPPSVTVHTLKVSKTHYAIQAAIVAGVSLAVSLLVKFL